MNIDTKSLDQTCSSQLRSYRAKTKLKMDAPIPEQSRKRLQDLFVDDAITANQWTMVVPKCEKAVECTPSDSDQYFLRKPGCQKEVKKLLRDAFDKIFAAKGHVMTFWDDFAMNVTHKLGLTYRELTNGRWRSTTKHNCSRWF